MKVSSHVAKRAKRKSVSESDLRRAAIRSGPGRDVAWRELIRRFEPKVLQSISRTLIRLGRLPHGHLVEDLVEATWVHVAAEGCRLLRIWNPSQGDLGAFLAGIGRYQTRTSSRLWARRKEVKLEEAELRSLADRPDSRLSPEEVAQLKEGEVKVQAWEADLGLLERRVWEIRKEGASSRTIGLFLGRDHKTVCAILLRLQKGLRQILEGREPLRIHS